jgi:hypothetical protein
MEKYLKPQVDVIILPEDVISTSCTTYTDSCPQKAIELPELP